MHQLGMMYLIYPMDLILFLIFKIILNTSLKNMKLLQTQAILLYKIKTGYKLELLAEETIQLLGSSKKVSENNKNGELAPRLETVEVVLVHCNLVNNNYQQASKVLFTYVPNKKFGQLITIKPHSPTMLKTTNAEFPFIEIWFTDQNNRPLEIQDNVNITLIIGIS